MRIRIGRETAVQGLVVLAAVLLLCAGAHAKRHRKVLPSRPIDLNSATIGQLEELPDVGPATARSILKFRRVSGPFERVDDLLAIRGISRRRFDKIRPYVFVAKKKSAASQARPRGKRPTTKSRAQAGRG